MARIHEAIELFREDFQPKKPLKAISQEGLSLLPEEWQLLFTDVGIASRKDGFLWMVDPADYTWLPEIFGLDLIPVARTSFADFYMIDHGGTLYSFLPQYRQVDRASSGPELSLITLADQAFTDDPEALNRHSLEVKAGRTTGYGTCYCLRPIVALGGSEEASELYIGDVQAYLHVIAQATS